MGVYKPVLCVSPSLWCSDEEFTQHPALFILIVSDSVVKFMTHCNLRGRKQSEQRMEHKGNKQLLAKIKLI